MFYQNNESEEIVKIIEKLRENKQKVVFSLHAERKIKERNLSKNLILEKIFDKNFLLSIERQEENKWKMIYRISRRQKLVIVVTFKRDVEELLIITVYKSTKDVRKLIKSKKRIDSSY